MKKALIVLLSVLTILPLTAQINLVDTARKENSTMRSAESGFAEEEFRRGVQSYYRGAYNEAIMEFEKALSYLPGENLILDWLGKAYYKAGIEGAALKQWNYAKNNNYGGLLLENKIEIVGDRRITDLQYENKQKYTECGSFPRISEGNLLYSQPVCSLANSDGSIWVVAYGSNELVEFDVNGVVLQRVRGPINGFDRPTDMIRLQDKNLLIVESAGDRLALLNPNGKFIKYIGTKGIGNGEFIGPQYECQDSYGNIYVTDFGNARVCVFDNEGNGLFTFGTKTEDFKGLKSPTGIAVYDDRIFVCDSVYGGIYEFDRYGNFISTFVKDKTFGRPEAIKNWGDYFIITDNNRVVIIDTENGKCIENAKTGKGSMLTSAVPDRNGDIVVTDIKDNDIYIMTKMSELAGGLYVQIERVVADNFPEVTLEVKVENRKRQQVVGLKKNNFVITEGQRSVGDIELVGSANYNDFCDITFLIDRNVDMKQYEDQLNNAIREIAKTMNGKGSVTIISAGENPVVEFKGNPNQLADFDCRTLKNQYTTNVNLDLGMRLAGNNLINAEKKRGVIYITEGSVNDNAFSKYGLSDICAYLNNNSISFTTIMLKQGAVSDEVDYITNNTNGKQYYIYRSQGLSCVIPDIIDIPSGMYQLKYTSSLPTEYGKKYLPVEVETYLLNRSGRDETGYFAPLQ